MDMNMSKEEMLTQAMKEMRDSSRKVIEEARKVVESSKRRDGTGGADEIREKLCSMPSGELRDLWAMRQGFSTTDVTPGYTQRSIPQADSEHPSFFRPRNFFRNA